MNTPNPYAAPRAAVADIAAPGADNTPAGRGTRLGAALLDGLIAGAVFYVPLLIGGLGSVFTAALAGRPNLPQFSSFWLLIAVAGVIAWLWITIVLVARNGQTIAKKLLGIKVVRADGSKATLGRIFWLRNFVNALLNIVPFYGFIDALFIFGEQRQCLHDKIADTIVIQA